MTVVEAPPTTAPEPVVVLLQQGIALFRQGDMRGAEDAFTRVMLADPANPHAAHILGLVAEKRGDYEMAEQLIARSVQLVPHSRAYLNLGVVRQHRGNLDAAIACYRRAIELEPEYADAWTNLLFALDMHPSAPWQLLRDTRDAFARLVEPLTAAAPAHANDRDPDRKLRVGYVGGDFRSRHSASSSFGFLIDHDPETVELYLYSTHEADDPTSDAFKGRADVWCEIGHLAPHELAQVIREDAIDILVDLGGASQGNRALVFAMKPSPIQVGGWGYPHGLGIRATEYMVGDPVSTPPEHAERYRERILMLPLLMGYRHVGELPDVGPPPQEKNGYRTYGYLGRAVKLTAPTLALWAEILRADPTGRLLLKSGQYRDASLRDRVVDGLEALGVNRSRIEVRGETTRAEHLATYNEIDVALDPLIHGGGQTCLDSCLMGVPTVTLPGETVSGRIGAAIMDLLGYDVWAGDDVESYIDGAINGYPPDRRRLRDALLASTIASGPRYARAVEAAYRMIWRRWCGEVV